MLYEVITRLEPPLQRLCQQLIQWLGGQTEPTTAGPLVNDIRPILDRLASLLADDDSEALTVLEEQQASLQQQAPRRLAQLEDVITSYSIHYTKLYDHRHAVDDEDVGAV